MPLHLQDKKVLFNYGNAALNASKGAMYIQQDNISGRLDLYIEDKHIAGGYGFYKKSDVLALIESIKFPIMINDIQQDIINRLLDYEQPQYFYDANYNIYYLTNNSVFSAELLKLENPEMFNYDLMLKMFITTKGLCSYQENQHKLVPISLGLSLVYFNSDLDDETLNTELVGAIERKSISIGDMKQMTVSNIIQQMLFKDYPLVITPPRIVVVHNRIELPIGSPFPTNFSYYVDSGSITVNGSQGYGLFGDVKFIEHTGENEDYINRTTEYLQTVTADIYLGTDLYTVQDSKKIKINKGDFGGKYDVYLNKDSKLYYKIQPLYISVVGYFPYFWFISSETDTVQKWTVEPSYKTQYELVIYVNKQTEKQRPMFACIANVQPKFYIYNELKNEYNEDEGGQWLKNEDIYYIHSSMSLSDTAPIEGGYTTYNVWKRCTTIDNTQNYKIKATI